MKLSISLKLTEKFTQSKSGQRSKHSDRKWQIRKLERISGVKRVKSWQKHIKQNKLLIEQKQGRKSKIWQKWNQTGTRPKKWIKNETQVWLKWGQVKA